MQDSVSESENGDISFSVYLTSSSELVLRTVANRYNISVNQLISHALSNKPIAVGQLTDSTILRSQLEIIFSSSQSTLTQLMSIVHDKNNLIRAERRNKIIAVYKSITELYQERKKVIRTLKHVEEDAIKNSFYSEQLSLLKNTILTDTSTKRRKNFRVVRSDYQKFKSEKTEKYGSRANPLEYVYERLSNLKTVNKHYFEDTTFHLSVANVLRELNEEFKSGAIKHSINSENEIIIEMQFTKVYNKLVEIYKILKTK
ncbi:hypothetical protein RX914_11010 [Pseudomonas syringae pv. actinidiae]|nr:hypothetical protein [Pseudomonas syringae pv. actinidiae]MDU8256603.1 hypothetical protein [Pseudomonas syringae pv. actinidiae]MDU8261175.1 hypothetical protein [Pseudomonas syringae pv. actinidiae]MDU8294146.1 hypothetical protein [Pseudomonas syringae pv. actinidiae]MDU8310060.1 hypothetical protein [Pseudomonas syringae pv. actinidiae]